MIRSRSLRLLRAALLGMALLANLPLPALAQTGPGFGPNYQGGGSVNVTGTGCLTGVSTTIQKGDGNNGCTPAASGTDFAPATSGTAIQKGNGSGGFSPAVSSTDYAPPTSGTAIEVGNGTGGFSSYAGSGCSAGQYVSAISAAGASTCSTPAGSGGTPANPTATAGPTAVNGVATTYARSDSAPAVQVGSNSQEGIVQCDGLTIACTAGTIGAAGSVVAGTTQTITAAQWAAGDIFGVTTAAQTLTLPLSSTLAASGTIAIQTIGQSVTLAPNAADAINGGTAGVGITIPAGLFAVVTRGAAANSLNVSPTSAPNAGTVTTTGSPANGNLAKFSGATSVTNGDLSGDVQTSGALVTTIANGAVTLAKQANLAANSFQGNNSGSPATPIAMTPAQAKALLALTPADIPATTLAAGTTVSLTAPRQYYVCTGTCTVTPPVPVAGYEFCVMNDDNVTTVITLAPLGSAARYEATARTSYGTAGTGTLVSGGAAKDQVCIVGRDSTHYLTTSSTGTWVAN